MSKFRLIVAVSFVLFFASSIHAADIAVDADCSLADAIIAANRDRAEGDCPAGRGADTIILSQTITLRAELPAITSDITIEGNDYTISGNNRYRIFYNDGGALTINDLTMIQGYVEGDGSGFGGAIYNKDGTLTISGSSFSDNLAEYDGGAIYNDGELSISDSNFSGNLADEDGSAIYNLEGMLSISDSTFSRNSDNSTGSAIFTDGELSISSSTFSHNVGRAILNAGELSITNSNFNDNSAASVGGAIYNKHGGELSISDSTFSHNSASSGGAIESGGELSISDSTFSHNSAWDGGAIYTDGELSIVNSTFSGNSAEYLGGGAIKNSGWGELSIINSTFSGNSAEGGGGAIDNGYEGKLRMRNSIIAGNGGTCVSSNRIRHNINNFIQDGSCSSAFNGDPKLGELVEPEDGSPAYFPLLASSPAIDAADDAYCPETDQIDTARPQGVACDIGAIEYVLP